MNTVMPLARLLEHELTLKLETDVKLKFDTYALDMVSRAIEQYRVRPSPA